MFPKIISYLEKLGYTVEEQGSLEKYLVVFKVGRPVGFILSDLSLSLVSETEDQESIKGIIEFIRKNQNLQNVGGSEFLLLDYCGNQLTTFYDDKQKLVKYASYVHDGNGEVQSTIMETRDTAILKFITQTQMIDLKKYLPARETFGNRIRTRLIHYLEAGQH